MLVDVPVKELPIFFQSCQEIGLTGEGVYYFLTSLDFHGPIKSYADADTPYLKANKLSDEKLNGLIFNGVGEESNTTTISQMR